MLITSFIETKTNKQIETLKEKPKQRKQIVYISRSWNKSVHEVIKETDLENQQRMV